MIRKRFDRKKFTKRLSWALIIMVVGWVINIIWFKPFFIEFYFERMFYKYSLAHPEYLTQHHAYEKFAFNDYAQQLNDISKDRLNKDMDVLIKNWDMLKSYRYNRQTPKQQISTKVLDFYWETAVYMLQYNHILYCNYPINHLNGAHISFIDFMLNNHEIKDLEDAENYLERLKNAPIKLRQMINKFEYHTMPPAPIIDKIILQVEDFIAPEPSQNLLYRDFQFKIDKVTNLPEQGKMELEYELKILIEDEIIPAYTFLLQELKQAKKRSVTSAGLWQLETGELYYNDLVKLHVTKRFTKTLQVDDMMLELWDEVYSTTSKIQTLLDSLGYSSQDSLKYSLSALMNDSNLVYQNTPEGQKNFLEDFKKQVAETNDSVSKIFDVHVENSLEIKPMVTHQTPYTSRLFYYPASLDDYRIARLFINIDSIHYIPKFMMPALIHNYVTPGEHFVKTVQHHLKSLPTFRRAINFDAYIDGWSFYAQRHLKEAGYYYQDPYEELGRLYQELLRGMAAITDYYIHKERFEREDAVAHLHDNTGLPLFEAEAMVDRLIVDPGRAFAYWAGYKKIMELRQKAQDRLKDRFILKEFHQAVLNCGPVPMSVLETAINQYIYSVLPEEEKQKEELNEPENEITAN